MTKFMSTFRKPESFVDISSNIHFPDLSSNNVIVETPEWNYEKVRKFGDNAKYYDNGDVYEGEFDEHGVPCYGKMTFANGDIYEGPIRDYWIKEDEEINEEDVDEDDDVSTVLIGDEYPEDEYYDDEFAYDEPVVEKYGKMTYTSGKVFWGDFCFPQRSKWT